MLLSSIYLVLLASIQRDFFTHSEIRCVRLMSLSSEIMLDSCRVSVFSACRSDPSVSKSSAISALRNALELREELLKGALIGASLESLAS